MPSADDGFGRLIDSLGPEPVVRFLILRKFWSVAYVFVEVGIWWLVAWLLLGKTMLPGGTGFALALLYSVSRFGAFLVRKFSHRMPPLLGMLVAGLLLDLTMDAGKSGPLGADTLLLGESFDWWSISIRAFALSVIMLRAGLGLNLPKLRKMGGTALWLSFLPCFTEALCHAVVAMPLLKLSWEWALTLGFVLSAVSPAVVVPGMLSLQARGYGTGKGIPTLVMAAASFDDVLAISGFGISLAFALAHEEDVVGHKHTCEDLVRDAKCEDDITSPSMAWLLLRAPLELLLGAGVGALFGFLLSLRTELTTRLTREHLSYEKGKARYTAAVLGGATLGVLGGRASRAAACCARSRSAAPLGTAFPSGRSSTCRRGSTMRGCTCSPPSSGCSASRSTCASSTRAPSSPAWS